MPLSVSPLATRCTRLSAAGGGGFLGSAACTPAASRTSAAVAEIRDPAAQAKTGRATAGVVAIPHALHASLDHDLGGAFRCAHVEWERAVSSPPAGGRRPAGDDDGRGERI